MAYVNSLSDILDAFSAEYYDPRDNISKILYEENRRKQNFAFGIVTDNQAPDGRGRIKVSLPMTARGYISKWIWVCHPYAGDGNTLLLYRPDLCTVGSLIKQRGIAAEMSQRGPAARR